MIGRRCSRSDGLHAPSPASGGSGARAFRQFAAPLVLLFVAAAAAVGQTRPAVDAAAAPAPEHGAGALDAASRGHLADILRPGAPSPQGQPAIGLFNPQRRDGVEAGPAETPSAPRLAPGEPVFTQEVIPDDNGVGPFDLLAIATACIYGANAADDFTLPRTTELTRIAWEAVYFGAANDFPAPDANIRISFYRDNGFGNVGQVVADYPIVQASKARHARPPVFDSIPVYTFTADLNPPLIVNAGERYWVSINGNPAGAGGPSYGWMASNEGNAADTPLADQPLHTRFTTCATMPTLSFTPGGDLGLDADLAFALYGTCPSNDCNCNGVPDAIDIATGFSIDCNGNGVPDECDIANGLSEDCDGDGVPDECQLAGRFVAASPAFAPFGAGAPAQYIVPSPPMAASDVAIVVSARSDFSHSTEFASVTLNGAFIGDVFRAGGRDCPSTPDTAQIVLSAGAFNSIISGGDAVITVTASSAVSASLCGPGSFLAVRLEYDRSDHADCNGNGVLDSCDIASGASLDCNVDGVPDECQLRAVVLRISPDLSPIGFESPQTHTLTMLPPAESDVTFTLTARSDLNAVQEWIDVLINGVQVGRAFESGARDCPSTPDITQLVVPAELFNSLLSSGRADITLRPSAFVSPNLCGDTGFIRVSTSYLGAGDSDCNGNGILDSCEIEQGASDENGNGILDICEGLGDLNGDGYVDAADLAVMLGAWGATDSPADLNRDGLVNSPDLALLLSLMR